MRHFTSILIAILFANTLASMKCSTVFSQDDSDKSFFSEQVKPLLEKHCYECHRSDTNELGGELAMASRASMIAGGESGSVLDEASPENSLLIRVLSYEDDSYQMPPNGKLSEEEIAVFRKWVELGLPWDPADEIELERERKPGPPQVNEETKRWWSFQKPIRPEVPKPENADWAANEIDAFIFALSLIHI